MSEKKEYSQTSASDHVENTSSPSLRPNEGDHDSVDRLGPTRTSRTDSLLLAVKKYKPIIQLGAIMALIIIMLFTNLNQSSVQPTARSETTINLKHIFYKLADMPMVGEMKGPIDIIDEEIYGYDRNGKRNSTKF
jgi:hypothetical protein